MEAKTIKQYVAVKKGGPFQVVTGPYPSPGPGEVCIRNLAVGLNPLDWKNLYYGEMVKSWPEVFGIDTAGIVESVGSGVTAFSPGDAVMSLAGHGGRAGAFQEVTTVPAHFVCKKPAAWTFEEASSVPICYLTAATAVTKALGAPLPYLREDSSPVGDGPDAHGATAAPIRSVLVVGGSSGVGASAVQLLRLALPLATIISTNSPRHDEDITGLGATLCVDRHDPKLVATVKSVSPGGGGVDAIIDAVGGAAENAELFGALRVDGPRIYSQVLTGDKIAVPDGVSSVVVFGRMMFQLPGGMRAMSKLVELVEEGKFNLPLQVSVAGKAFEAIGTGLESLKAGVSRTKLVVSL
ncbi:Alcohol dehydrogenase superfamily, zinc-type [Metarhizium album ARSEF 1941]|uniref:Alcohol dehydrogenase superfamily, zinc-type n=1 Tax=Metarhizium album (strain ARSEF 1941) TaxID=1081103 RepID=A0A0B2WPG7_METAS|nr:Alcohol dehydrogenase superfamily, zinc-type [Metarhizium album ARSEF 1941]KHN94885.1 Alcohol dehydrogenase superfamily, zinc-type [Metarhizium album ARSEF 1941]